jgi:hypothetical protein
MICRWQRHISDTKIISPECYRFTIEVGTVSVCLNLAFKNRGFETFKNLENFITKVKFSPEFISLHLSMKHLRQKFSTQDDQQLTNLVQSNGENKWRDVAGQMDGAFSARQCRERWWNYLNPYSRTTVWNDNNDNRLLEMYQRFGSNWEFITKSFPEYSINTVRNRFFVLQRKLNKKSKEMGMQSDNEVNHIPKQHLNFKDLFQVFDPRSFTDVSEEDLIPKL